MLLLYITYERLVRTHESKTQIYDVIVLNCSHLTLTVEATGFFLLEFNIPVIRIKFEGYWTHFRLLCSVRALTQRTVEVHNSRK